MSYKLTVGRVLVIQDVPAPGSFTYLPSLEIVPAESRVVAAVAVAVSAVAVVAVVAVSAALDRSGTGRVCRG